MTWVFLIWAPMVVKLEPQPLMRSQPKECSFWIFTRRLPVRLRAQWLLSGNDNHVPGLGQMGELLAPNQKGPPGYEGHLNDRVASMAEVLKDAGYHTYMAGKWHMGHSEDWYPYNRGFDQKFTMLVGAASHWADILEVYPQDDPASYAQNGEPNLLCQCP
jgi:Sulfatase